MGLGAPEQETHTLASDWCSWPLGHSGCPRTLGQDRDDKLQLGQAMPCPPCPRSPATTCHFRPGELKGMRGWTAACL